MIQKKRKGQSTLEYMLYISVVVVALVAAAIVGLVVRKLCCSKVATVADVESIYDAGRLN